MCHGIPLLVQERITGQGAGIFTLFNQGKPIVFFAHKRLREKPPTGGVSVLRESIPLDQGMKNHVVKLLSRLNWHGVAMVEFKLEEKTGIPYLIEVNGRLWGSLQLAIDAGVDFPYLLYKMALGELPDELATDYKTGVRSRWLLGDADHLYMRLLTNGSYLPPHYPSKLKCIMDFLKLYEKNTRYEIESFSDPGPWLYEVKEYIRQLFR
jgi:predicted ATP-grasp superfamily ATP-dependent carboligase